MTREVKAENKLIGAVGAAGLVPFGCALTALALAVVRGRAAGPGGRTMIGGVEARALEDDAHRRIHLVQGFFPALRAPRQGRIRKALIAFELDAAVIAPIGIDRHTLTSLKAHPKTLTQG